MNSDILFSMALAALKRIARKPKPFFCKDGKYRIVEGHRIPEETCDCPKCIASDALVNIKEELAAAEPGKLQEMNGQKEK